MRSLIYIAAPLLLCNCVSTPHSSWASDAQPAVILISLDGFRADYLSRYESPTLKDWARRGVRAKGLTPVFPSYTYPNHYSMITGLYPESHGIVANEMYDPETKHRFSIAQKTDVHAPEWWGGEPLWVAAEKQGVLCGSVLWIGSSSEIGGARPRYSWKDNVPIATSERVQQTLAWLDLPVAERPRLLMLWLDEVDIAGHDFGPQSDQVARAIASVDKALGDLDAGLRSRGLLDRVNLVVVSDHGMTEVPPDHFVSLANAFAELRGVSAGHGALVGFFPEGNAAEAVSQLGKWIPHARTYLREDFPARFHYRNHRRIAPVLVLADEGWYLVPPGSAAWAYRKRGAHGYDNELPSMQGIFLAKGPAFRPGLELEAFSTLEIYSLVRMLLKLKPPPQQAVPTVAWKGALTSG